MGQRHPLRILVAEDNTVNQKVALRMLERLGYRADVAANGIEVLEALGRQAYDVVLLDVQMPDMDGLEAAAHIRQDWPKEQRPRIVALTAHALQGDRERFLEAGMDDYISKPVRPGDLVSALEKTQPIAPTRVDDSLMGPPYGPAAPVASTPAGVDASVLTELHATLGEDAPEIVDELIDLFLDNTATLLTEMRQALDSDDAEQLRHAAHTIKSGSATLGALRLSEVCRELEAIGRAGTLEEAKPKIEEAETEYEVVKTALGVILFK